MSPSWAEEVAVRTAGSGRVAAGALSPPRAFSVDAPTTNAIAPRVRIQPLFACPPLRALRFMAPRPPIFQLRPVDSDTLLRLICQYVRHIRTCGLAVDGFPATSSGRCDWRVLRFDSRVVVRSAAGYRTCRWDVAAWGLRPCRRWPRGDARRPPRRDRFVPSPRGPEICSFGRTLSLGRQEILNHRRTGAVQRSDRRHQLLRHPVQRAGRGSPLRPLPAPGPSLRRWRHVAGGPSERSHHLNWSH